MKKIISGELDIAQVKSRTIRGLTLLVVREFFIKLIAVGGQLVLVRLLLPEQFGVMAIFTFLINVGDLFTDVGSIQGVIRSRERPSQRVISSLFYVKMVLTSVVVLLLCLSQSFFGKFLPAIAGTDARLFIILSLTLLIRPLRTLMYGLLERELRYDIIPIVDIVGLLVYFTTAIILAVKGFGIWSLVWSVVIKDICEVVLLELLSPFIPSPQFDLSVVKPYLRFGIPLQLKTILNFLQLSTIPLLGGMLTSSRSVGLLDWSFNIASLPRALTDNVGRVSYASFSRIQDCLDIMSQALEEALSLISLPIMFLIAAALFFGKEAILLIIGPHWVEAAMALNWLLIAEMFLAIVGILQQAIVARGLTRELLRSSVVVLAVQWGAVVLLTRRYGFIGIAIGIALGWALQSIWLWKMAIQAKLRLSFMATFVPTLIVFLLSLPMGYLLNLFPSTLIYLVFKLTLFSVEYVFLSFVIAHKAITRVIFLLRQYLFS